MGKAKDQKGESVLSATASFTRMNFLYQASLLTSKIPGNTSISCYLGKLMKEISKKTVEKIHPDIKRTMCCACNSSLSGTSKMINVKVKCHPKRRKKKKVKHTAKQDNNDYYSDINKAYKSKNNVLKFHNYKKTRLDARNRRPNTVIYVCATCKYSKSYIQKPNYDIWINKMNES